MHAYLFLGAAGSGARPAARAFAAAALCARRAGAASARPAGGPSPGPIRTSSSVERTGASLGVDDARRLVLLAQRRPFEADRQVLVVTDVHLATALRAGAA